MKVKKQKQKKKMENKVTKIITTKFVKGKFCELSLTAGEDNRVFGTVKIYAQKCLQNSAE